MQLGMVGLGRMGADMVRRLAVREHRQQLDAAVALFEREMGEAAARAAKVDQIAARRIAKAFRALVAGALIVVLLAAAAGGLAGRYSGSHMVRADGLQSARTGHVCKGVTQYVILGAGLDTFAQRRPDIASRLRIFEVDRPAAQAWKRQRLIDCGFGIPAWLRLVPVDFEAGQSWWDQLTAAGFDANRSAVVVSTGVSMYLTRDSNLATLRQVAQLARGSTFAMTFLLPLELVDAEDRASHQMVYERARAAGTPFVSFFSPPEMLALAREAGFSGARHVSTREMIERYFARRTDGLRPASGEEFLIATM
jgi:methyltransferase (TIGR00027 family)